MIKHKIILVLLSLTLNYNVSGQSFISAYTGSKPICGVTGFLTDSVNNKLYMHWVISNSSCNLNSNYIACNQNNNWSYLGPFDDVISSLAIYNNELYSLGYFNNVNGQSIANLAKFNGISWVSVTGFSNSINPWRLKTINNELYLCGGTINTANGSFNGVAKFNGTTWSGFNTPYLGDIGFYIADVTYYNNELYLGGNFQLSTGEQDLIYLHNSQWQKPSNGIIGSYGSVNKLEVYKNRLYIGGLIYKSEGNVGNMLVGWDGSNLMQIGDGLKDNINSYGTATVKDMMVFNNQLYIAGVFNYAGNIFSCGLTTFDGNSFCSLNKTPQVSVGLDAIGHYKDTLWISGSQKYLNDSIKAIGKYIGNSLIDTCSLFYDVSTNELNSINDKVTMFPIPSHDVLNIKYASPKSETITVSIYNVNSKIVFKDTLTVDDINSIMKINVQTFVNGLYYLQLKSTSANYNFKFLKE